MANKKDNLELSFLLVDPDQKLWNTYLEYMWKWYPDLKLIYEDG